MTDNTLPLLPEAGPLDPTDLMYVVQAGGTADRKVSLSGLGVAVTTASVTLNLAGTVGATVSQLLATVPGVALGLQVTATTLGSVQNYALALTDGSGGAVLYEATGITAASYTDNAPFFLDPSDDIWLTLTNIDPDAAIVTVTLRYLNLVA